MLMPMFMFIIIFPVYELVELKQFWQRWWSFTEIVILVSVVLRYQVVTTQLSNKQKSKIVCFLPLLETKLHKYAYISMYWYQYVS